MIWYGRLCGFKSNVCSIVLTFYIRTHYRVLQVSSNIYGVYVKSEHGHNVNELVYCSKDHLKNLINLKTCQMS